MAIQITTTVGPDGTISIRVPELRPGERVTVSVEPEREPLPNVQPKRRAADILAEMPGHLEFHTAEEVDAYIRQERDSWER